jgi:voltage-gated potassium channel Kch
MPGFGFGKRFRYWFDNMTSRGPGAMIVMLFILTVCLVLLVTTVVKASGSDPEGRGFLRVAWAGLMRTLDPGTMGGDEGPVLFLLSMLTVTVGGIFVVGTLIGIITTGIDSKLEQLRKGRSFVAESDHTIILGWSPQVFTIISELVEANASRRRACIAVLAEKDKVEMEDEIRSRIPDTRTTRVVCRTGCPIELVDLEIVNHRGARAVIVLPEDGDEPDSCVIKTILALVNNPSRRPEPYHIVGVLRDPENMSVAEMVGGDEAQLILAGDMIARISAQTCRQSGLSVVYTELLDFGGDEIYFREEAALTGMEFRRALHSYEDSTVIGIRRADGSVLLNPPMDSVIARGDSVVVISEDDDTIRLSGKPFQVREDLMVSAGKQPSRPERTLILGWNGRVPIVVRELDGYVAQGSEITVVADPEFRIDETDLPTGLRNVKLRFRRLPTTDRETLETLDVGTYDHVILQSYSDFLGTQQADARSLISLLHLRDLRQSSGASFSIVSEMMDDRNRQLAEVANTDDFIVSDKLISLMLSQVAENRELKGVFRDLFDPEGSEVYIRPVGLYVKTGVQVDFHTVVASAVRRGETAIGYRILSRGDLPQGGIVVNPDKSAGVVFGEADRIIVLAED